MCRCPTALDLRIEMEAIGETLISRSTKIFAYSLLILVFSIALAYIFVGANYFATLAYTIQTNDYLAENAGLIKLGVVQDSEICENSGIAMSHVHGEFLWMHNDSGNKPVLFLVAKTGQTRARCEVADVNAKDWEDICSFQSDGKSYLVVGDVGDNSSNRTGYNLLLMEEPKLEFKEGQVTRQTIENVVNIEFQYEDGPKNCEAIGFDPVSHSIWLIEKIDADTQTDRVPGVYSLPLDDQLKPIQNVARRISDYPVRSVTGMDFYGDDQLIIRNYVFAHLLQRKKGGSWQQQFQRRQFSMVSLPIQRQGEAICFDTDGNSVIVASEFRRQPLYQVKLDVKPESGKVDKEK